MAAISHVLAVFLQIYLVFLNIFYVVTAKKCADANCKVPILLAVALDDHEDVGEHYINFKKGDSVTIFSKHVGTDDLVWEGSVGGAPAGLLKSDFVKVWTTLVREEKLLEVASKDEIDLKASKTEEPASGSHQKEDVINTRQITDVNQADSSEDINDSPVENPSVEESNLTGDKVLANENKDGDTELKQDKILNENERTVLPSEPGNSPTDEGSLGNDNNHPQIAMTNDEKDMNVRNAKTEIYTDPNGVQYDVKVEYLSPQDEDSDDVKLLEKERQEQSDVDVSEKLDDLKENDELNQETPGVVGDGKQTGEKKKEGFFSSFTTLVTDFTENVMKDFSGEDVENGKVMKDSQKQDHHPEDHESGEKTEQKEFVDDDGSEEATSRKLSEVEGVLESVQKMKEEQLETKNEVTNVTSRKPSLMSVAEVERLKEEARKVVMDISGLVEVNKESDVESKTEVTDDELKNKDMLTQESAGVSDLSSKKYSDIVLCRSIAIKDREVCMTSGSKEECLMDNCCFDETADPGLQCFFKPSTPESDITEEDLLSKEDKKLTGEDSDEAVKEDDLESNEPVSSTISEQPDQNVDVSSKKNISSNIELDGERKIDIVDKNGDESEHSAKRKIEASGDTSFQEGPPADSVHKTDSLDERNESSQNNSSEKSPAVETVDDSASKEQNEGEQSDYVHIDEGTKNITETDRVEEKLKTDDSGDSSREVKAIEDVQMSSDVEERNEETSVEPKDDSRSDEKVSISGSSENIGKPDPLKKDASEGREVRSDQALDDGSSSDQNSSAEKDVHDAGSRDDEKEAADEDVESVEKTDELEPGDSVETQNEDKSDEAGKEDEVKSDDTGPQKDTEELTTGGSVSNENIDNRSQQESSKDDITAVEERQQESGTSQQDSQDSVLTYEATLPEDISEDKQEVHSENESNEKKADSTVDVEGILDKMRILLPGGDTKQDAKSKDEESLEDVKDSKKNQPDVKYEPLVKSNETNLNETSAGGPGVDEEDSQDNVPLSEASVLEDASEEKLVDRSENLSNEMNAESAVNVEGILGSIKNFLSGGDTKDNTKSKDRSSSDEKSKPDVKFEPRLKGNETDLNKTSTDSITEQGIEKDLGESATSTKDILAKFLEEESLDTKDATVSDTIIPETKDEKSDAEKTVESGSTHFLDSTEPTSPVEKTLDKGQESNDSSLKGREETKTEIESTISGVEQRKTGIEETKAGLGGAKPGIKETTTELKKDVVPTKTIAVEPSPTIIAGQKPFEKKFPNIASKWMKNKLMKGKRTPEKHVAEETLARADDPLSGTCAKHGTCEKINTFPSRAILENYDNSDHDDDIIVESSPEERDEDEQPEVKSVKRQFLETVAVAVRQFREYHAIAAFYGLQMLKPVMNIVKTLGKQMGLEESIDYLEHEMGQGPQGWIAVTLIMIAFTTYCLLNVLCGKKVPPCYGPNLKDIFKTYEGRIRILEEECQSYEEKINNLKNKADEDVENNSALEKQLDDEKHERRKSEEQISILKEIVKNLNEKVDLLKEESSNLKQSLDEKSQRINSMEEQLLGKSREIDTTEEKIKQLEEQLKEQDKEKNILNENIEEYKNLLSKAEDDTDRHKTMLQDWNDRYHELQQKYDDISVSNQTLEEQIHFKDNEIEVLRDSLVQINSEVHINSDEELPQEEMQEARSNKIKELMDVSQVRTDYKVCKEEKEKLEDDMKQEVDRREKLEGEIEQLEIDLAKSKASEEEIRFKYREADIKLNALQDYFKNMESDLHRKLTAEEAARMASESELERKLREASTAVQDVELYRKQVEELRKEIDETQHAFRSQISSAEDRAHENWLKFRTAERELEEMKRERDALRRRLYDLETSTKPPVPLDDTVSSTTADNLESSLPRSESPATSVRSSKRNNSNPRKSPSGSPLDERKERTRRKTRDRNSPPSWDSDMGPPPRRRDKDRETPPPPPPLWEPNMGVSPRRKGRRDSPNMPTSVDADMQRKRRERFTPSPPPPPPDSIIPPSRRRLKDRPSPSSSPPPPPPPTMFPPRGVGLPMERPPPEPFIMGAPPTRMNSQFNRPPLPEMMPSHPIGGGINRTSLENTPPQAYMRRGGGPRGPPPPANTELPSQSRINNEMPPSGVPPFGTIRPTGENMNLGTLPPPVIISSQRGIPPEMGTPNEQASKYINSGLINNAPDGDKPPPPPAFARNGPYRRPPPGKIQTLPS